MKKNNTAAFVLTLIAAIWAILNGGLSIVMSQAMDRIPSIVAVDMMPLVSEFMIVVGVIILILGVIMLIGSIHIKNGKRSGAILSLVASILSLVTFQLISGILGLIGTILAFKKTK